MDDVEVSDTTSAESKASLIQEITPENKEKKTKSFLTEKDSNYNAFDMSKKEPDTSDAYALQQKILELEAV